MLVELNDEELQALMDFRKYKIVGEKVYNEVALLNDITKVVASFKQNINLCQTWVSRNPVAHKLFAQSAQNDLIKLTGLIDCLNRQCKGKKYHFNIESAILEWEEV